MQCAKPAARGIDEDAIERSVAARDRGVRDVHLHAPRVHPVARSLERGGPPGVALNRNNGAVVLDEGSDMRRLGPRGRAEIEHPLARTGVEHPRDHHGGA